jgi:hypothetical protein
MLPFRIEGEIADKRPRNYALHADRDESGRLKQSMSRAAPLTGNGQSLRRQSSEFASVLGGITDIAEFPVGSTRLRMDP